MERLADRVPRRQASGGSPCQDLDFGLLASNTVSKDSPVVQSTRLVVFHGSLSGLTQR